MYKVICYHPGFRKYLMRRKDDEPYDEARSYSIGGE